MLVLVRRLDLTTAALQLCSVPSVQVASLITAFVTGSVRVEETAAPTFHPPATVRDLINVAAG